MTKMMQAFSLQDKNNSQIMKQKIVLHVPINEEKSRAKAMSIASKTKGVTNVAISKERNHMVVIGEGVDSVSLANSLRKRLQFADIVSVKSVLIVDESVLSKDEFNNPNAPEYQNQSCNSDITIRPKFL
ncbi:heavy metal-associated isoprenylated plant protein 16-like [Primulina huaijiensis]|uniref:heavy metal-associated isoprenylated plant protein 16-like n=1 Tax=Primulina huaijiensis TaxID=1492673 RepID=UPI003CC72377